MTTISMHEQYTDTLAKIISGQIALSRLEQSFWKHYFDFAIYHGVVSIVDWYARQQNFEYPSDALRDKIKQHVLAQNIHHALYERSQEQIQSRLDIAGIPCVWLKGSALAPLVYPETYLRPMIDIDVLVPMKDRKQALDILVDMGYKRPESEIPTVQKQLHHYELYGGPSNLVMIELHFALLGYEHKELLSEHQLEWFIDQIQSYKHTSDWHFTALNAEAHLLYLCAHALIQHGENEIGLIHLYDIHSLINKYDIDWDLLITKAIELRWAYALEVALLLVQRYFMTVIPETVIRHLHSERRTDDFVDKVTRFQTGEDSNSITKINILFQSTPLQERPTLIRDILFPSTAYMMKRYKIQNKRMVWLYYPYRWLSQLRLLLTSYLH